MDTEVKSDVCEVCKTNRYGTNPCWRCARTALETLGKKAGLKIESWDTVLEEKADSIDVTGRWVDNGIGAYEYWGFRGVDKRIEFEMDGEESGEIEVAWTSLEMDVPEDKYSTKASTDFERDACIELSFKLGSFTSTRHVKEYEVDGKKATIEYWSNKAEWSWEASVE